MLRHKGFVSGFVFRLQSTGRYGFSFGELASSGPVSTLALQSALKRLVKTGTVRRVSPRGDYFVIVPAEYHTMGAPPVEFWIDDWMRHLGQPYYIGLLSAAEWQGSAHFAVMQTQVMTSHPMRPVQIGRTQIRFFSKTKAAETPVRTQTPAGHIVRVSTPEATLLDLSRHISKTGGAGNLALIARDLAKQSRVDGMKHALDAMDETSSAQRLGYVLEQIGATSLAKQIESWLADRHMQIVDLLPQGGATTNCSKRWQLRVNAGLEASA